MVAATMAATDRRRRAGHRSSVIGHRSLRSLRSVVNVLWCHDVNRVNQSVTREASKHVQDDRVLQAEAEGGRARDAVLENDDALEGRG